MYRQQLLDALRHRHTKLIQHAHKPIFHLLPLEASICGRLSPRRMLGGVEYYDGPLGPAHGDEKLDAAVGGC
jgi:hypothetical protein